MDLLADILHLAAQVGIVAVLAHVVVRALRRVRRRVRLRLRLSLRLGLATDAFERLKERVHKAMERPGCRLQIYWRSFWASCGDRQRFEWRDLPQAVQTSGQDS